MVKSTVEWLKTVYGTGTAATPKQFYATFLRTTPNALPSLSDDDISAIKSTMTERPPYEADIPLKELAKTSYPKLIISGKRQRERQGLALVKICDILEKENLARNESQSREQHTTHSSVIPSSSTTCCENSSTPHRDTNNQPNVGRLIWPRSLLNCREVPD